MRRPFAVLLGGALALELGACFHYQAVPAVTEVTTTLTQVVTTVEPANTVLAAPAVTVTETVTVHDSVPVLGTFFDHTRVEAGVTKILTDAPPNGYGQTGVTDVSCPADQAVKTGATFTCTATIGGAQKQITVTVKDDSGKYEVGVPR